MTQTVRDPARNDAQIVYCGISEILYLKQNIEHKYSLHHQLCDPSGKHPHRAI